MNPGTRKDRRHKRIETNIGNRDREETWRPKKIENPSSRVAKMKDQLLLRLRSYAMAVAESEDYEEEEFWSRAMPTALYDILASLDTVTAYSVCDSFRRDYYYE